MPMTAKGQTIMANMQREYGPEKGERVFYASRNAGRITGVDPGHQRGGTVATPTPATPSTAASWLQANPGMNFNDWVLADQAMLMGQGYGGLPSTATPTPPAFSSGDPRSLTSFQRGGLVDHDDDPDLPPAQEEVQLVPLMEHQQEPAYLRVMRELVENQRRLNQIPLHQLQRELLRRYWLGGLVRYWRGGHVA